ncbi:MAG: hypothetical protein OEZ32_13260 [Nitrospinota bacterium]|nr:hypothetical protein [Nitrospinota bacterium]
MDWWIKLKLARRHIGALSRLRRNPTFVESLTQKKLTELGAQVIILDHDGVLGANRSVGPDEAGQELIRRSVAVCGPGMVFILSNTQSKRNERRVHYNDKYKDVVYLVAKAKPDPDGIMQAAWASGAAMDKIAMVDDGLLTGVLMALESGSIAVHAKRRVLDEPLSAWLIRLGTTWPQYAIARGMEVLFLFK